MNDNRLGLISHVKYPNDYDCETGSKARTISVQIWGKMPIYGSDKVIDWGKKTAYLDEKSSTYHVVYSWGNVQTTVWLIQYTAFYKDKNGVMTSEPELDVRTETILLLYPNNKNYGSTEETFVPFSSMLGKIVLKAHTTN